jgi:uncharacterized protein YndB with AHSA1/START domain
MVTHSTFTLERSYAVEPEKVFAAFSDPAKKRHWYVHPDGVEEFQMDFRVGGTDHVKTVIKEGPVAGMVLTNDSRYQDIIPNRRIVVAYTMALGGDTISASQSTFEFVPTEKGTDLVFTEQGAYFENSGGPEMRQDGWWKLFNGLDKVLANG